MIRPIISPVKKVAYAAMILCFYIVSTRLLGLAQAGPIFSFNRLGIGTALIMYTSLALGPFYGALVGVAGDALGWVLLGQWTGAFNVFLSVYYALVGVLPWLLTKLLGGKLRGKVAIGSFFAAYAALFIAFLCLLWFTELFNGRAVKWGFEATGAKAFVTVLCSVFFVGSVLGLLLLQKKRKELGDELGEISILCLAVELVTIFLKPLAFFLYCLVFLGERIDVAWGVSYSTLVMLAIVFAFVDLVINVAMLRLLLWLHRKYVGGAA